ncbi:MAG: exodeoxyribonuclease III [Oscillospiraceae bacterium]|jgi:exodeoxyribonuclease-3|nr:exodeoxyribonuclease III [Oscillospiraceae bacterium]
MRLISWNVNGIRACRTKGFDAFFSQADADIFCLQEVKATAEQSGLCPPGYFVYWHSAERAGYSGTAVLSKFPALSVRTDMENHTGEGRIQTLEFADFFLVNVYVPNSKRELLRLDYRMVWQDAFTEYLISLDAKKPLIVCGDLNVAHQEIDIKHPKANRRNAGFTDEERGKMTKLLAAGFTDIFRARNPEERDAYTWWSYMGNARQKNVGWRIDYFLVSDRLAEKVASAPLFPQIMGSDHCPVGLTLSF